MGSWLGRKDVGSVRFRRRHLDEDIAPTEETPDDPELRRAWKSLAGDPAETEDLEPEVEPSEADEPERLVDPSDPVAVLNSSLVRRERRRTPNQARHRAR